MAVVFDGNHVDCSDFVNAQVGRATFAQWLLPMVVADGWDTLAVADSDCHAMQHLSAMAEQTAGVRQYR